MPMGQPIRPRPINPTFLGPAVGIKRDLLESGERQARRYFPQTEDKIVAELRGASSEAGAWEASFQEARNTDERVASDCPPRRLRGAGLPPATGGTRHPKVAWSVECGRRRE